MAFTKYDICSQALTLIRANTISSFTEGTNESDVCGIFYDSFIRDIFSRAPWSFALKKRLLSRDATDPVNEYKYRHIKPSDCERIWAVSSSSGVGDSRITDYDVIGNYLESNNETLYMEYVAYVSEETWPGYFIQYAVAALAALLAMPISDQQDIADRWQIVAYGTPGEGEKGGRYAIAAATDMQQKAFDTFHTPAITAARFS